MKAPSFTRKSLFVSLTTAIVAAVAPLPGIAQENAGQPRAQKLEEIVVTARRREESLQSVPITIAAFDQQSLKEKGINSTQDLQFAIPGVFLTGSGSRSNTLYSIRGQSKPSVGQGAPGVVTYFADVPLPVNASSVPQFDIQSIQVLKGPQGTLFGRNTTGGAILTYPNKPSYDFGGYIEGGAGEYDYRSMEGAVNIPLIDDKLAIRLAAQKQDRDGYTKNIGQGGDLDELGSQSLRASILFEPTDRISNLTVIDHHENDASTSAAVLVFGVPFPGQGGTWLRFDQLAAEQKARGPRKIDLNLPETGEEFTQQGITNRTDIDFDRFQITNIIGYRTNDVFIRSQIDGMGAVPFAFSPTGPIAFNVPINVLEGHQRQELKQFTEEFHLKGQALEDKLDWLLGVFYLNSEPDGVMASATGFFSPTTQTYQFVEDKSKAVFANITYDLGTFTEGLSFNLGLRKTWDESNVCAGTGEAPLPGAIGPTKAGITNCSAATLGNFSDVSSKSSATTWTVGLDWQVNDDMFAYVTSRKGYRAGGLNAPQFSGGLIPYQEFDPEETVDVELGLRTNWMVSDMDGRFNVALFRSEASDVQVNGAGLNTQLAVPGCNPVGGPVFIDGDCNTANDPAQGSINVNVGDTRIQGVEMELVFMPSEDLTFSATATYQDTETTDYTVPPVLSGFFPANEVPFFYTPQKTATLGARYLLPVDEALGDMVLNANYYFSDKVDMIQYQAKSYKITNLRADWLSIMGSSVDVGLFVNNVFDEEAVVAPGVLSSTAPFGTAIYNPPRMWGMEVQYRFGVN
ncbi:MAG: TonB-dependent receptor [Pseudomonadota bacterium]|nr:TonB-dependent receptor [Pseudomonadota bacterium]